MPSLDTINLKSRFDLREFILRDTGQEPAVTTRSMIKIFSPIRPKERTPSFAVWPDHYFDFGTNDYGDIIEYVQQTRDVSFTEACRYLSGDDLPVERREKPIKYKKEVVERSVQPLDSLQRYVRQLPKVMTYLLERGISENIITRNVLGGEKFVNTYVGIDGKRIKMEYYRVMLPQIFNNEVYARNFRRDELSCDNALSEHTFDVEDYVRRDLELRNGSEPSDGEIRDALFGPRFWKPKGTRDFVFGIDQIFDYEKNDSPYYMRLPYVLIDEGEFNALSLQSIGIRCVQCKALKSLNLKHILRHVDVVYIPVHNDPDKVDNRGRVYNAGRNYADMMADVLERNRTRVRFIYMPDGYNDVNDLHMDGRLANFLKNKPFGIRPEMSYA